jgi:uncharacterized protein
MAGTTIVDADGHVFEDAAGISEFVPAVYTAEGPLPLVRLVPALDHLHTHVGEHPPGSFRRNTGPAEWIEFLDDMGIAMTVLYPTFFLAYGKITSLDWAIAATRAYNDWLHATYLRYSRRFVGMGLVPLQDPAAAVAELRRIVGDLGMRGAILPSMGLKAHLGSKEYWPVYAEAERLGCCLAIHGGCHSGLGMDDLNVHTPVHALGHPHGMGISFAGIVFNGIFDKFPGVRVGFLEAGVAWLLMALERFDRSHETHRQWDPRGELLGPQPEEKVSEYVLRHVRAGRIFVGCEGSEPALGYAVQQVGSEPWLYSSDFPHEVNNEFCRAEIEEILENPALGAAARAAILAGNAERFYAVRPTADQPSLPVSAATTGRVPHLERGRLSGEGGGADARS